VFKVNTNGTGYTNMYDFTRGDGPLSTNSDGRYPACNLVLSGNTLYGTTTGGGLSGSGTVFAIHTNGTGFRVIYYFSGMINGTNSDGSDPQSGLTLSSGVLYGTASTGGAGGNGTIFRLNTDGSGFATLHHFSATNNAALTNSDGARPVGGLILVNGALYGTTSAGGTSGYGTIFSILFPPQLAIALSGTNAILSWPTNSQGFNLESTTNLAPPATWSPIAGQYMVTNPIITRQKFYRLNHP
jgi:uncharacterized repeat protein (TIGR03803 family)